MMMTLRADLQQILTTIPTGASVLDLGCGDGALLEALITQKNCKALGVELDEANVKTCMAQGLPVFHGTLEEALADYPPHHFDFVVLNQTLQRTQFPVPVVHGMLRVGKRAIVGFPNFGHWQIRLALLLGGRMPSSNALPYHWYDTPNIHLFTIADFQALCQQEGWVIERWHFQVGDAWRGGDAVFHDKLANWLGTEAVFHLKTKKR
jgi:methionine biosynthesis protein MetW